MSAVELGASAPRPADGGASGGLSVRVSALEKFYGRLPALGPVDLDLHAGEFVSVIGPSGCGKSTLLLLIAGLLRATEGSVEIGGQPQVGPHPSVSLAFQRPELMSWRTVLENVLLPQEIRKLPREEYRQRARDLLAQSGLERFEDAYPDQLSGGMAQRVALCRALLHRPGLLLLDEPLGALDALTRDRMGEMLRQMWRAAGCTSVLVTHSLEEAVYLGSRVVVMTPRPARIAGEVHLDRPPSDEPPDRDAPEFITAVGKVRALLHSVGAL